MTRHVDFYFDFGSPTSYLAWTQLPGVAQAAVERDIFGAPTMFVGDEMHFGQDRLDFVREALQ